MNVAICDDDSRCSDTIEAMTARWAEENGQTVRVRRFASGEELLSTWKSGQGFDLIFLDIQIPQESGGLEVAAAIRKSDQSVPIAFVSGYSDYAFDGYLVNAIRYIMKPFDSKPIRDCLNIALSRLTLFQGDRLQLQTKQQRYALSISKILYLEVQGREVRFYTTEFGCVKVSGRLGNFEQSLPASVFGRCHKSYIVNIMFVHKLDASSVTLADGTRLPVGRKYAAGFCALFDRNYFS